MQREQWPLQVNWCFMLLRYWSKRRYSYQRLTCHDTSSCSKLYYCLSSSYFDSGMGEFVGDDDKTSCCSNLSYSTQTPNALLHQPRIWHRHHPNLTVPRLHVHLPQASQTASRRLGRVTRPVCLLTCGPATPTPGGKVLRHLGLGHGNCCMQAVTN